MQTTTLNKANVEKLETEIRALIEPERRSFVTLFSGRIEHQIAHFLAKRQPNQTLEEFYRNSSFGTPQGVRESLVMDSNGVRIQYIWKDRPAFSYHRHEQATEIIQKIAERNADNVLTAFINRTLSKLGPVVERKDDFKVSKATDRFSGFERATGHWEGNLYLSFEDGTLFSASLQIITNYSKFGEPFGQYPMRFFDSMLRPGIASGSVSIEEIWESVGYTPPLPAKKPRWTKVVSGSVLLINDTYHLVTTPGKFKNVNQVAHEQVARIHDQTWGALVEYSDGTEKRYRFTDDELAQLKQVESAYQFNKALKKRREFAFQALFGKELAPFLDPGETLLRDFGENGPRVRV
jgi:hypothetical protein